MAVLWKLKRLANAIKIKKHLVFFWRCTMGTGLIRLNEGLMKTKCEVLWSGADVGRFIFMIRRRCGEVVFFSPHSPLGRGPLFSLSITRELVCSSVGGVSGGEWYTTIVYICIHFDVLSINKSLCNFAHNIMLPQATCWGQ